MGREGRGQTLSTGSQDGDLRKLNIANKVGESPEFPWLFPTASSPDPQKDQNPMGHQAGANLLWADFLFVSHPAFVGTRRPMKGVEQNPALSTGRCPMILGKPAPSLGPILSVKWKCGLFDASGFYLPECLPLT